MTGAESLLLRQRLAPAGYRLRLFPYSSVGESMPKVAARLARFAAALRHRHGVPVHFLGHSLGGLVVYRLFEQGEPARCGLDLTGTRVVLLGTPAKASQVAQQLGSSRLGRFLMGAAAAAVELLLPVERRWRFAPPLGLICGDRGQGMGRLLVRFPGPNDGTVQVAETALPGASDWILLPVSHTGLLLSKAAAQETVRFLETAAFSPDNRRPV